MKQNRSIVIFDLLEQQMDIYKDMGPAAERVGLPRTTLQSRLDKGVQYIGSKFVGYGTHHKSGRGGAR